jgi:ATP-binding cassette subfamily F protein 3
MPLKSTSAAPELRDMAELIQATAQQSRFHVDTLQTSKDIDLKAVTITVGKNGQREILVDTDIKLKEGCKYALIGR